jgi:subtilisin family serine protease
MISRVATELCLTLSPTITFLLSVVLLAPARSQEIPVVTHTAITTSAPAIPGRYLIVYRNGQIAANAESSLHAAGAQLTARHETLGIAVADSLSESARAQLALDPTIESIVPDVLLSAQALSVRSTNVVTGVHNTPVVLTPNMTAPDALYHSPQGWAVRQVGGYGQDGTPNAPSGPWNTTTGKGIRIAILDSGVDPSHPDIAPNLALNLSEVSKAALPSACDDGSPIDQQGHGTWTASLAAAALGPNTGLVAGVAPSASILNIKVLERLPAVPTAQDPTGCLNGQASGLLSWVIQGISDAIANRADVISMSFGTLVNITTGSGAGEQVVFNRATAAAFNAGILLVAAAGNDAANPNSGQILELPAQSRDVLAVVASTNPACAENLKAGATCVPGPVTLPYYSNFGTPLNALAAPGGSYPTAGALDPSTTIDMQSGWVTGACSNGIPSTLSGLPTDVAHSLGCFNLGHASYVQAIGTSASAPLVAGAAALLMAAHPAWSPSTVTQTLRTSAAVNGGLLTPQATVGALLTPRT